MEIKVINKVFNILELMAQRHRDNFLPSELAENLNMPNSTCVRLLKIMTALGYVEQISRCKGYRLGPMSYYLGHGEKYDPLLFSSAEALLRPLSDELKISVELSVRHENFLMIVCGFDGDPTLRFDYNRPRYQALHLSVSGRMLLSHAPENVRREIVESWPDNRKGPFAGKSSEEILLELENIARRDEFGAEHNMRTALAIPVKQNHEVVAVLGAVWNTDSRFNNEELYRERLHYTADKLSDILSLKEIY